jgi:hypothetical protein
MRTPPIVTEAAFFVREPDCEPDDATDIPVDIADIGGSDCFERDFDPELCNFDPELCIAGGLGWGNPGLLAGTFFWVWFGVVVTAVNLSDIFRFGCGTDIFRCNDWGLFPSWVSAEWLESLFRRWTPSSRRPLGFEFWFAALSAFAFGELAVEFSLVCSFKFLFALESFDFAKFCWFSDLAAFCWKPRRGLINPLVTNCGLRNPLGNPTDGAFWFMVSRGLMNPPPRGPPTVTPANWPTFPTLDINCGLRWPVGRVVELVEVVAAFFDLVAVWVMFLWFLGLSESKFRTSTGLLLTLMRVIVLPLSLGDLAALLDELLDEKTGDRTIPLALIPPAEKGTRGDCIDCILGLIRLGEMRPAPVAPPRPVGETPRLIPSCDDD